MVGVFTFILQVNGSNLTNGVFVEHNGRLIEYFLM